ncbi:putative tRNA pseudouridine synthase B [Dictyocoela muelleri]|nr:putative tRNA pseudouridine synthase B [Dictyocoela muelleri]
MKIVTYYPLGKKDKKKIEKEVNKKFEYCFNDNTYTLIKCDMKIDLLFQEKIILFKDREWYPTLNFIRSLIEKNNTLSFLDSKDSNNSTGNINDFNIVYLDEGALSPVLRGANIMAPGIYKYRERVKTEYKINDLVLVDICGEIVAIGVATIDFKDIKSDTNGVAVIVKQFKHDKIDKFVFKN